MFYVFYRLCIIGGPVVHVTPPNASENIEQAANGHLLTETNVISVGDSTVVEFDSAMPHVMEETENYVSDACAGRDLNPYHSIGSCASAPVDPNLNGSYS